LVISFLSVRPTRDLWVYPISALAFCALSLRNSPPPLPLANHLTCGLVPLYWFPAPPVYLSRCSHHLSLFSRDICHFSAVRFLPFPVRRLRFLQHWPGPFSRALSHNLLLPLRSSRLPTAPPGSSLLSRPPLPLSPLSPHPSPRPPRPLRSAPSSLASHATWHLGSSWRPTPRPSSLLLAPPVPQWRSASLTSA